MTQYTKPLPDAGAGALSGDERSILLLTCPCHFLTHFFILVFPAVTMPIVASLGMPLERVVTLSFLMYLAYGLGALPVGYIVDRWQARKMLLLGVFAMGVGLTIAGIWPTARVIPGALLLVGIGGSVYHPAGLALISRTVTRRGYALGINGVWGNLGIATAPFVTGILTWLFSWQKAFLILGISAIVTAVLLGTIRVNETIAPRERARSADDGALMKYYVIMWFALIFGGLAYRGNMTLMPAYLELKTTFFDSIVGLFSFIQARGTATLAATTLTSIVLVMGTVGQLIGGRAADRFDLRYAYLVGQAAAVPFLLAMAFTNEYLLAICAAMFIMFSLGMQPIENSLIAALTPTRWRSTGFAIKFVLNFGIGSAAVYLIGFVKTRSSLEAVYVVLAGIAFLLVLSIIALVVSSRRIPHIRN